VAFALDLFLYKTRQDNKTNGKELYPLKTKKGKLLPVPPFDIFKSASDQ
jgi:hypothetical protein